jgi:hypothetical protein
MSSCSQLGLVKHSYKGKHNGTICHSWGQVTIIQYHLTDMGSIQFRNWNCIFKKMELELKFAAKKLNPEINLPYNFLIQKYVFHDNATWNLKYSE